MPAEDLSAKMFDLDTFNRAREEIEQLRSRLPQDEVQELAREVIVRLSQRPNLSLTPQAAPTEPEIETLCHALISEDPSAAATLIMRVRGEGVSIADLYLYYLAVAARRLGDWWTTDHISFIDVTIGVSRIYGIMKALRPVWKEAAGTLEKSAVFATIPGDDHSLGVTMATDLFRQEGWSVDLEVGLSHDDLVARLGRSTRTVVGLSGSGRKSLSALVRLVLATRISNPSAFILVSGHIVVEEPEIVAMTGADGAAQTVPQALQIMNRLIDPA